MTVFEWGKLNHILHLPWDYVLGERLQSFMWKSPCEPSYSGLEQNSFLHFELNATVCVTF